MSDDKDKAGTEMVRPVKSFEDDDGIFRSAGSEPFAVSRDTARDLRANGLVVGPDEDVEGGEQPVLRDGAQPPGIGAKRAPMPQNKAAAPTEAKDAAEDPRPAAPTPAVAKPVDQAKIEKA